MLLYLEVVNIFYSNNETNIFQKYKITYLRKNTKSFL